MNRYIVYTAAVGKEDQLRHDQCKDTEAFVAFCDGHRDPGIWELRDCPLRFKSPRRNSRMPKILAHQFVDAEMSLWLDSNIAIRERASIILDEWLSDSDIAVFTHESRNCLFDEASVCRDRGLDDAALFEAQVLKYSSRGVPRGEWLARCSVIARRHTHLVERFNDRWWSEHCAYSVRDQISFVYAAITSGVKINVIKHSIFEDKRFAVAQRGARKETVSNT